MIEAAPLERVMQLARAVGGEDHDRTAARGDRAQLGHGDREVRQELEQERLELVIGTIDLVDQQHDRPVVGLQRLEQRPAQQEAAVEQLALVDPALGRAQREQLARVVPVIDGVVDVDALVALQADQPRAERRRPGRGRPRSCRRRPRPRAAGATRSTTARSTARPAAGRPGSPVRRARRPRTSTESISAGAGVATSSGGITSGTIQRVRGHYPAACSSARRHITRARWRL